MSTIATEWEKFRKDCLPPETTALQVNEMRRAFYTGFAAASTRDYTQAGFELEEYHDFVLAMKRGEA